MSLKLKLPALRWILFILNTLLPILGIALIATSLQEMNTAMTDSLLYFTTIVQIFVGAFVVLTSFLGCYGTCRTSFGLTCSYGICLLILLAFHIYIIVIAVNGTNKAHAVHNFELLWNNHTLNMQKIADIQQQYKCCGRYAAHDYILKGTVIPNSCYKNFKNITENLYIDGCVDLLEYAADAVETSGFLIKCALFITEFMAFICASLLATAIHSEQRRANY